MFEDSIHILIFKQGWTQPQHVTKSFSLLNCAEIYPGGWFGLVGVLVSHSDTPASVVICSPQWEWALTGPLSCMLWVPTSAPETPYFHMIQQMFSMVGCVLFFACKPSSLLLNTCPSLLIWPISWARLSWAMGLCSLWEHT